MLLPFANLPRASFCSSNYRNSRQVRVLGQASSEAIANRIHLGEHDELLALSFTDSAACVESPPSIAHGNTITQSPSTSSHLLALDHSLLSGIAVSLFGIQASIALCHIHFLLFRVAVLHGITCFVLQGVAGIYSLILGACIVMAFIVSSLAIVLRFLNAYIAVSHRTL